MSRLSASNLASQGQLTEGAFDGCAEVWLACRHTWGWNNGDLRTTGWSNADFAQKRKTDKSYQSAAKTWQEQRSFVPNAVDALGSGKLQSAILAEWQELKPVSLAPSPQPVDRSGHL